MNECPVPEELVVYGSMFTTTTSYSNVALTYRFSVEYRGLGTLRKGIEWEYLTSGVGFNILIPSWSVSPDDIFIVKPY